MVSYQNITRKLFFFKNHAENEAGRLVPESLFVFQKSFMWVQNKWSAAWHRYILIALSLAYNKNKLYKTLGYWSRDMLNFGFLEKGLGIVSAPIFVYDFSRKIFIVCIVLTDQISLSACLYFLRYWAICV